MLHSYIFNLYENVSFSEGVTLIVGVSGAKTAPLFNDLGNYARISMFRRHGTESTLKAKYSAPEYFIQNLFYKKLDVVFCYLFMLSSSFYPD